MHWLLDLQTVIGPQFMAVVSLSNSPQLWLAVGQIIAVDILLAGDNAVIIALACRMLPSRQRFWGMILGAGVAVLMRVAFTLVISGAMNWPFVKLGGGLLLLWIAIRLIVPDPLRHGGRSVAAADNLLRAIWIIAVADLIMSLDNVVAIAALADTAAAAIDPIHAGSVRAALIAFGLACSIPLIVAGSAAVMWILERFPLVLWGGGALLGWIAGGLIAKDPMVASYIPPAMQGAASIAGAAIAALVVVVWGYVLVRKRRHFDTP